MNNHYWSAGTWRRLSCVLEPSAFVLLLATMLYVLLILVISLVLLMLIILLVLQILIILYVLLILIHVIVILILILRSDLRGPRNGKNIVLVFPHSRAGLSV